MSGRESKCRTATAFTVDGFFGRTAQAILIASRHKRKAGGRADRRIRVSVRELHSLRSQAIQLWRDLAEAGRAASIAAQIGKPQIVGYDKNNVGLTVQGEILIVAILALYRRL